LKMHMHYHTRTSADVKHHAVKRARMVEERGHQCEVCRGTEWMGQSIPLQIDHIDGNSDNNAPDNFRLICPNCHAQTPTYCGKNIGKNGQTKRAILMKNRTPYRHDR
jgi:5-methylcytosine-specific restriction endonuclease McrA